MAASSSLPPSPPPWLAELNNYLTDPKHKATRTNRPFDDYQPAHLPPAQLVGGVTLADIDPAAGIFHSAPAASGRRGGD